MRTILPSFAKGEISPELHGRVDAEAYPIGLAKARNCIVHTYGGISRRPGTKWIAPVADHDYSPRLVPFAFKTADQYILEFGDEYMRVIRDDGHVVETAVNISGATKADPVVITTSSSHGYSTGDEVFISGVGGMTEINNLRFTITVLTATTFSLQDQVTGVDIDGTGYTTYTSGGTSAKIFELATPYTSSEIWELGFTQSADVMTIVHKNHHPRELSRTDHDAWTLSEIGQDAATKFLTALDVTVDTSGSDTVRYIVTHIDRNTGLESLPGRVTATGSIEDISGATQANPVVITTSTTHVFENGDEVLIFGVGGMAELNNKRFIVQNETSTTFELYDHDGFGIDGTGFGAYTSGGKVGQTAVRITNSATTRDNTVTWNPPTDGNVLSYRVYREENGLFGFIGETYAESFKDDNITPDTTSQPPYYRNPWITDDFPGAVGYFQQRRVFGGSSGEPDTSEFTQIGNQSSFVRSPTTRDDDSITATISSRQVNEIRYYVPLNDLLVFTSGSEWLITAGSDNIFAPSTIQLRPQSYWGSSYRPPIIIGNIVIFVTEDEGNVRTFGYSLELDGYTGSNLNITARHLTQGHTIEDWCATKYPDSRIYMIRSDGTCLTLSLDVEQEMVAWTWFDTSGFFEACASLRGEGAFGEDSVYFVARRTVDGNTVRYIEVMRDSFFDDPRDCFFVDSGLSLDNPFFISDVTSANPVVVTTETAHGLDNGAEVDIFDIVWEPDTDSFGNETQPDQLNTKRFKVKNKTSTTFELTDTDDNDIDGSAFNAYVQNGTVREAFDTVSGMEHLEGRDVAVLADGNVITDKTVVDGIVSFDRKFSRIHIGLKNVADIETLNIEMGKGTIQGLRKKVNKAIVRFFKSRGLYIGPNSDQLVEMKQRDDEAWGDPTALLTGDKEILLDSSWNTNGRVFLRQNWPLPLTVLAIIPQFELEDDE